MKLVPLFNESGKLVPTSHRWGHPVKQKREQHLLLPFLSRGFALGRRPVGGPGGAAFTGGPWYARSADFTGPQAVGTHVSLHDQPCLARSAAFTGYYEAYLVAQDAKAREQS